MHHLRYSEFYITNVCNLNCPDCNRFNNFAFTGHQLWDDYKDIYAKWAKILSLTEVGILGGEPLLNPDFPKWLNGIAELWPQSLIRIVTNGTQMTRWPNLYELVAQYGHRIIIEVSAHNRYTRDDDLNFFNHWLATPIDHHNSLDNYSGWANHYNIIKGQDWPECPTPHNFENLPKIIQEECRTKFQFTPDTWKQNNTSIVTLTDVNGVQVVYTPSWAFNNGTIIHDNTTGKLRLHSSDPAKAMEVCYFKPCHHFIKGKLYKCGPVGLLPDFIKQFPVDITEDERQLIDSYQPAEHDWNTEKLQEFVQGLRDATPIKQCTFCPEQFVSQEFNASNKKIKIVKLTNK